MAAQHSSTGRFQWRVTQDNPVRLEDSRLDFERCAALHNELLELGWTGSGKLLDELETKTWFESHGEEAENSRSLLSEDLAASLDRALINKDGDYSLSYYVYGLVAPERLWQTFEHIKPDEERPRYLTLYGAHSMVSRPDGLVFDMKTNKATMQMSIHDTAVTLNGRIPWYPLEVILSAWLDMVDVGKIKAVNNEVDLAEKYDPWICLHWNSLQVEETVTALYSLVDSIGTRMQDHTLPVSRPDGSLLTESTLDAAKIPHGFARSFLYKARRPPFRFVAPGLRLPDQGSFLEQPFTSQDENDEEETDDSDEEDELNIKPILLFCSSQTSHQPDDKDSDTNPFNYPYSQVHSFPSGLYLTESERIAVTPSKTAPD